MAPPDPASSESERPTLPVSAIRLARSVPSLLEAWRRSTGTDSGCSAGREVDLTVQSVRSRERKLLRLRSIHPLMGIFASAYAVGSRLEFLRLGRFVRRHGTRLGLPND